MVRVIDRAQYISKVAIFKVLHSDKIITWHTSGMVYYGNVIHLSTDSASNNIAGITNECIVTIITIGKVKRDHPHRIEISRPVRVWIT